MKQWTYGEAKQKIQKDLDLQEETFISDDELLGYFNDAIDEAEAEIHNLFEDYFLSDKTYTLLPGTNQYPMPDDIYANKIRFLWFNDGNSRYQIKRTRERMMPYADMSRDYYTFQIKHRSAAEGIVIELSPAVKHDGPFLFMQFIRNANRLSSDADIIDIPECMGFIFAYVAHEVCRKETHPLLPLANAKLEKQRDLMKTTLKSMTVDDDNEIEPDLSFYEDMN